MDSTTISSPASCPGTCSAAPSSTLRRSRWWLDPLTSGIFLLACIGYAGWAGLQARDFATGPYISPLYSPCVAAICARHASFVLVGAWWHWSPALVVVALPAGVRLTCYYYRKLYYRALWLSPPACAVGEPRHQYHGESRFPLILQNAHRWFWYAGVLVAVMLTADSVHGFFFGNSFGIGVGSVLIAANALFFWAYLLSCHALRHLVGGGLRSFSDHPIRWRLWRATSRMNVHHGQFALVSLPLVLITDGYVRLVATGVIADPRLLVH
jgi:hypothetical protein